MEECVYEEAVFVAPTEEEIALFEKLYPLANRAHKNQAQLISVYDLGAASRYLDLMCSGQYKSRKAIFPMKRNEKFSA
ncbi:hypothetical protein F7734_52120 [Scytonema sp. UIC 10036]|uniref:hypothetical protein n=1 Tax=Scytonema sp. UIC 10036 TaxID=2304196 RepID=UPI0012DAC943|nr:hypothetical protein [Scytonema sp. UIC 10036]MUH00370.1 hypothetical protein [Scytonema sp. UIC 10036]